jgi:hypothetical protein
MRAFDIHSPLPAAGRPAADECRDHLPVLARQRPGLVRSRSPPLVGYGVSYSTGVAYGFGLQAIEASVGIGVGLLFLAREGSRSRC